MSVAVRDVENQLLLGHETTLTPSASRQPNRDATIFAAQ
jgi:hypothetical protein